jgi:hypothetical protein
MFTIYQILKELRNYILAVERSCGSTGDLHYCSGLEATMISNPPGFS